MDETINTELDVGSYFIRVFPFEGDTDYTLVLSALPYIDIGATSNGALESNDSDNELRIGSFADDYLLSGSVSGQEVQIDLVSDEFDAYLQLLDANTQSEIAFNDDVDIGNGTNSQLAFTVEADTDYLIRVTSFASAVTGNYTLSTTQLVAGTLTFAQDIDGSLQALDPINPDQADYFVDDYRLATVPTGQSIQIDLKTTEFDGSLQLLNEDTGEIILEDSDAFFDNDSQLSFVGDASTNYIVRVSSSNSGETGQYSLSTTPIVSKTLNLSDSANGNLDATDLANPTRPDRFADDYLLSTLPVNQQIRVNLNSDAFDTYLQLIDADTGNVISDNDDSASDRNSELIVTGAADTDYLIRVTSFTDNATGAYTISTTPITTSEITADASIVGTLDSVTGFNNPTRPDSFANDYRLVAAPNQEIEISLESDAFDAYLQIIDATTGQEVLFDDDSGVNSNATLRFVPETAKTYLIRVTSFSANEAGSYTLSTRVILPSTVLTLDTELLNDTGDNTADNLTSDPTISVTLSDNAGTTTAFFGQLDNNFAPLLLSLTGNSSVLDLAQLEVLNGGTLSDGQHSLSIFASDGSGRTAFDNTTFILDTNAPVITAQLANDTGVIDDVTNDPSIIGSIEDISAIASFRAGFDDADVDDFVDVSSLLQPDNSFTFDATLIDAINGEALSAGEHTLYLIATDEHGVISDSFSLSFTLEGDVQSLTVMPGEVLTLDLQALFGADSTYTLQSETDLPTGMLESDGTLVFTPAPDELGTYRFAVLEQFDGIEEIYEFSLEVAADPLSTTRISGIIENTDQEALAGITVAIGDITTTTAADGSFTLEFAGDLPADALRIEPGQQVDGLLYPNISEKLPLVLGHEPYDGFNNVIDRPIYLPPIDVSNAVTIDPAVDTTVTTSAIPGASVFVAAGSLENQQDEPFTGQLSITEVPRELTPAALPDNLLPDLVVTIQPGEMVFNTPAPLSLPNLAGYAPGTVVDLWSINPETGDFDNVGTGEVSADGSVINTISGGIQSSSWHFFAPPPPTADDPADNDRNEQNGCNDCKATGAGTSVVELHSGAVIEAHDLAAYQSLGEIRGVSLTYDSRRADPQHILHFGYNDVGANSNQRLVAELTVNQGGFAYQVPGFEGGFGLDGGEHFWSIPSGGGDVDAALQADLTSLASGQYDYDLDLGLLQFNGELFTGSTSNFTGTFLHVNTVNSAFGSGWGLAGVQELVENTDGSILLIDGDGSEMLFTAPETPGDVYGQPAGDFSTLERLADGTFQRTLTDQTIYRFDANNHLVSVTDRNGNETQHVYDDAGQLSKIIDPVGLETSFAYTDGRVTSITDPAGRVTQLAYDADGNLTQITDPDGTQRTWEYDADHHMTAEIDKRGFREETFYDFAGRADYSVRKDGSRIDINPTQVRGLYRPEETTDPLNAPVAAQLGDTAETTYVDANGNTITTVLDQFGQEVSSFDEVGILPSVERNEDNLVSRSTNARGDITAFDYDNNGNLITITDEITTSSTLVATSTGAIGTVNNLNGIFTAITSGPVFSDIASLNSEEIFGVTGNDQLYSLDVDSGESTLVGNLGVDGIDALGFGNNGLLYATGESSFYTVDISTGLASVVNDLGPDYLSSGDIVFDPIRNHFWATATESQTDSLHAITLDGIATRIGAIGFTEVFGISIDLQGNLIGYTEDGGQLLIDKETGVGNLQQNVSGLSGRIFGSAEFATGAIPRQFTYDPIFNQLTSITDELGRQTLFNIDPTNGNTLSMTEVIGEVGGNDDLITQFTYTDQGLVDIETDPLGRKTDYEYTDQGLLTSITFAVGTADEATRQFEYDAFGNQTSVIDENGNRTDYDYDALNRLESITEADPDGSGPLTAPVTTFLYDDMGNLTTTTDALGNIVENSYDALNRLRQTEDELDQVSQFNYDSLGNLISVIDPLGHETRNVYDPRNRLIETIDPERNSTFFNYDLDNNLTSVSETVDPPELLFFEDFESDLSQWTGKSDGVTNGIIVDDPLESDQALSFTALASGGDILTVDTFQQSEKTYRVTFDYLGLPVGESLENDMGGFVGYSYDLGGIGNGQWLMGTRANIAGQSPAFVEVDTLNQWETVVIEFEELSSFHLVFEDFVGSGGVAGDVYFDNIRLEAINTPEVFTTFDYDVRSRVVSETDQLDKVTRYEYDAVNNLTEMTDRNGRQTEFIYDDVNRLVTERWIGDTQTIFYDYDNASNLTSVTDEFSTLTYTYDNRDRVLSVGNAGTPNTPDVTLNYTYDAVGNVLTMTDTINGSAGGTQTYDYDALNRLANLTQAGNGIQDKRVDFGYNALGQLTDISRYSDLSANQLVTATSYSYDTLNRLEDITHANSTGTVAFYNYDYDDASRISQITDIDGTNTYTYDDRDQLVAADYSNAANPDETYGYDANGNRTNSSLHGNGYVTGDNNQLLSDGTYNYTYDDEGNLLTRTEIATGNVRTFTWDYRNRLITVTDADSTGNELQRVEYTYDAFDRRISKTINGSATTHFVYDGTDVLLDFIDSDGVAGPVESTVDKRYLHGPAVDQVLAQEGSAGEVNWHLTDHLGTVRDIADSSGNVVNHLTYDSFGSVIAETNPAVESRYLYTGREFDEETGLYYYRARYYDAEAGRFISEDPIGFGSGDGLNVYAYTLNDPISNSDPLGLFSLRRIKNAFIAGGAGAVSGAGTGAGVGAGVGALVGGVGAGPGAAAGAIAGGITGGIGGFIGGLFESPCSDALDVAENGAIDGAITGALGAVGGISNKVRQFNKLSNAGKIPDRNGLTQAGRALQKHGDRVGSAFPRATGKAFNKNSQGQDVLNNILRSKNRRVVRNRYGGKDIFDNATGRGARYDKNGNLKGFLEPPRE